MWRSIQRLYKRQASISCATALCSRGFTSVHISEEVQHAIRMNRPVVALESTIISHGMPYPENLKVASEVETMCREAGVTPATVAIINGFPKVGLHAADFEVLGQAELHKVHKCSRRDISVACATGRNAATTVAGTMFLAHKAGIRIFATGGIGGVHREINETLDISADLNELGRTPVAVVCAGIKSILDIPRSLEFLETQGVPVVGLGCEQFPAFFHNDSGIQCPATLNTATDVARMLFSMDQLGLCNGAVIAVPNPAPAPAEKVNNAIAQALKEAEDQGIRGWRITPFLLKRVNELTQGGSLVANVELIKNNVKRATEIATAYQHLYPSRSSSSSLPFSSAATARAGVVTAPPAQEVGTSFERCRSSTVQSASAPDSGLVAVAAPRGGKPQVVVIGGAVVDMSSRPLPDKQLIMGTSNPGTLTQTFGGVGRNVAEAAARLGTRVALLSAVADDPFGKSLLNYCSSAGVDTRFVKVIPSKDGENRTATYSAVLDEKGQLHVAIADMRILKHLGPEDVRNVSNELRTADFVVVDGNIDRSTFTFVANACRVSNVPLFFEPTSVPKSVLPIHPDTLGAIDITKPNEKELVAMVRACYEQGLFVDNLSQVETILQGYKETSIVTFQDVRLLGASLLRSILRHSAPSNEVTATGANRKLLGKHVLVTLGADGLMWIGPASTLGHEHAVDEQIGVRHLPARKVEVVNCTGAGDTMVGTVVWGLVHGKSVAESIAAGMEASIFTLASPFAVAPELNSHRLAQALQNRTTSSFTTHNRR